MIKIFQTERWQFVSPSKVSNVKNFYDPGDLENKLKVKHINAIKGLVVKRLRYEYQMVTDLWKFVCPIGYNGKIELLPIESRNEDAVTLFWVCLSIHLRHPQVWCGTTRPSSLKTICLFRWKPNDYHWKCLSLLWPWQTWNWSGWCMLVGLQWMFLHSW